jgi:hypothetical protein
VEGLREIPDTVCLTSRRTVDFVTYRKWESDALERLADEKNEPAETWSEIVRDLVVLVHSDAARSVDDTLEDMVAPVPGDFSETPTVGSPTGDTSEVKTVDSATGVGETSDDPRIAADILLRDLAIWCELLVGLEAADPMAIRRMRSSLLRVRGQLGQSPDAAPVLAERARLLLRRRASAETSPNVLPAIDLTDPEIRAPAALGSDPSVQRRFLSQALMAKRLFEFSSIDHGVAALTVFLSALRLITVPGDEYSLSISDVAYLSNHPQLTDIVDSREVVHQMALDGRVHRAILGLD